MSGSSLRPKIHSEEKRKRWAKAFLGHRLARLALTLLRSECFRSIRKTFYKRPTSSEICFDLLIAHFLIKINKTDKESKN